MQSDNSFWRSCNNQEQCHCDWRLTIYDCEESDIIKWIYISNGVASLIVGVIAMFLLYYRVYHCRQNIFDTKTQTGFIRPKPIEGMILFALVFNFLRLIHSIILVTDVLSNVAFRSFAFEFPWAFGYAALASYVFGIAHTMSDSSHVIYNAWFHNPLRVDILCSLLIILPIVSNNICSISAGVYARRGEIEKATLYTHILYYFWTIYCGTLGLVLLYSGIRLVQLLNHHLKSQLVVQEEVAKVKTGILKVKSVIIVGCCCLFVFAIIVCLYGVLREKMMDGSVGGLLVAAFWTFDGPIASILVELALILNPHMTGALGLVAVNASFLTNLNNETHSWADGQHHSLSPTSKSVTSSSPNSKYQHQHRQTDYDKTKMASLVVDQQETYDRYSIDTTSALLAFPSPTVQHDGTRHDKSIDRKLEQDQLQYNAVTHQARMQRLRPSSSTHRKHGHPPPSTDNILATYY